MILIAIPSCHALRHWHEVVRSTWGKDVQGADLLFFLGNPQDNCGNDEIYLDVSDGLPALTHKVVAMYRWALARDYTHVVKCDLDCFVRPALLMQSGFEAWDYVGGANFQGIAFASGGGGYVLSRKAMQIVTEYPITTTQEEDVHVARALLSQGIALHSDRRYKFCPGDTLTPDAITYHLSSVKGWDGKATPEDLRSAYAGTFKLPQQQPQQNSGRWLRRLK